MSNRSTPPPTALRTGPSKPRLLLTLSVLVTDRHAAVAVGSSPVDGPPEVHDWSFPTGSLDQALLDEIEASVSFLAMKGLVGALGLVMTLPFELLEAYGPT